MAETSRTNPLQRQEHDTPRRSRPLRRRKKRRQLNPPSPGKAISSKDAQRIARGLPQNEAVALYNRQIQTLTAARALALEPELESAIEHVRPSPAVAAGKAASQRALDRLNLDAQTRLLTPKDMAAYAQKHRNWPAEAARRSNLIGIEHAGRTLYPAFQIDPDTRKVHPWVPKLTKALEEIGIDGRAFTVWAAIPSSRFHGDRPADHAGDADFLPKAASDLAEA